ncbi:MAG: hypothetical protein ACR2M6_01910 [Vampirovibrionia bacterium]
MRRTINPNVLITSWDKEKNKIFDDKDIDDGKLKSFSIWLNRKLGKHNLTPQQLVCEGVSLSAVRHWMKSRCTPREDKVSLLAIRLENLTCIKSNVFEKEIKEVIKRGKKKK